MTAGRDGASTVPYADRAPADPDLIRAVNEKVAIIQGFTDLLKSADDVLDGPTVEWALDSINAQAEGLKRLVLQQEA